MHRYLFAPDNSIAAHICDIRPDTWPFALPCMYLQYVLVRACNYLFVSELERNRGSVSPIVLIGADRLSRLTISDPARLDGALCSIFTAADKCQVAEIEISWIIHYGLIRRAMSVHALLTWVVRTFSLLKGWLTLYFPGICVIKSSHQ